MMEFGVQESWTQFVKNSFHDLLIDYANSDWEGYEHCCENPDLNPKIQDFSTFFTFNDSNS